MITLNTILLGAFAILLYLGTTVGLISRLGSTSENLIKSRIPLLISVGGGLFCHGVVIYLISFGTAGMSFSFFNALSWTAWFMVFLFLLVNLFQSIETLGIALLLIAALALGLELMSPQAPTTTLRFLPGNIAMTTHIITSTLAFSLLTIASIQAVLLALQESRLHHHRPGGFLHALPPLATMEKILFQMIGGGFILLTTALVSGFWFLTNLFAQHLVHKTVFSLLAWVIFAILLWGRWQFGWRGRTAIRWTLGGVVALLLGYLGSKFVLELILKRV